MFGFVTASTKELSQQEQQRYREVYCGICRQIQLRSSQFSRVALSYDMVFLALLHMSLYEPEETTGTQRCVRHPICPHPWVDNSVIEYCADMNVALAYYNFADDCEDEGSLSARFLANRFGKRLDAIAARWPRQCAAMDSCIRRLRELENRQCANPDEPAQCFGELMGELLVYREDLWAPTLRQMGQALGRFIYLTDAAVDYHRDEKRHKYNPFLAMGAGEDWTRWEEYLVLTMARCTASFEKLPLVQDKSLLDNILYSGVWCQFRAAQHRRTKGREESHDGRSL